MGKVIRRIFLVIILVALLVAGGAFALFSCSASTPLESARTSALNSAIEALDLKGQIDAKLRARAQELADEYGLPSQLLDGGVDMLAIDEWEVVNTPTDNEVKNVVDLQLDGTDLTVTTYEQPDVISVESSGNINTFGQTITFSVPESAQGISNVLELYADADEAGLLDLIGAL